MNPAELFELHLDLIERVIATVCRRSNVYGADAEDFASNVKVALLENDYDILRRYQGRASFATYLSVVVQRFLFDHRNLSLGRWHVSREAARLGEAGVMIETLIRRDGRSLDEALPLIRRIDPAMTRERLANIANRLPERVNRPRLVELTDDAQIAALESADARAIEHDARRAAAVAHRVVRETLDGMSEEDRTIIRLRFVMSMSIADTARMLRLPQRPLYRRIESLLQRLRGALAAAGIDARDADEIINVGAGDWEIGQARQFDSMEER
jgi:RNA polymerase sigma factor (sigma-70 family)